MYGNKIVFYNTTPWWSADSQKAGVYVYDLETQGLTKIYSGQVHSGAPPVIYGHTVVWSEMINPAGSSYLHVYDLETTSDVLVNTLGAPSFGYLSIFRDKIVWVGTDWISNRVGIYLYDITTGEQSRISSDTAEPWGYGGQDIHEGGVVWSDYRSGTTHDIYLYQFASPNNPPTLSFPTAGPYAGDGIDPNIGDTSTQFTFRVVYTDIDNNPPATVSVWVKDENQQIAAGTSTTAWATRVLDYANGQELLEGITAGPLKAGAYSYYFEASDGKSTVRLPETGGFPLSVAHRVNIDIRPGSDVNPVNLKSKGVLPVAIFGSKEFDVSNIDPLSISLAGARVQVKGKGTPMTSLGDINNDGLQDLIVHIDTEALQLSRGDTKATLRAMTMDGGFVIGSDPVRIEPF